MADSIKVETHRFIKHYLTISAITINLKARQGCPTLQLNFLYVTIEKNEQGPLWYETLPWIYLSNLKIVKNNTNFGQITGVQEKLDTTCK